MPSFPAVSGFPKLREWKVFLPSPVNQLRIAVRLHNASNNFEIRIKILPEFLYLIFRKTQEVSKLFLYPFKSLRPCKKMMCQNLYDFIIGNFPRFRMSLNYST